MAGDDEVLRPYNRRSVRRSVRFVASSLGVIHSLDAIGADWRHAVLTIGNFDGVHHGHQSILLRARQLASEFATHVAAMTFEPHPVVILRPDRAPPILTPLEEKCRLLQLKGADGVLVVPVSRAFLDISAEQFVQDILIGRLAPKAIVEGGNFGFGHDRRGNTDMLRAFASRGDYVVEVVEAEDIRMPDGSWKQISSGLIRDLLRAGDVATALRGMHRPYELLGTIVRGAGVGKTLGYPTINLESSGQLIPAKGVYAGWASVDGVASRAAISIGRRETFGGERLAVEAFLLDVEGTFYDKPARIAFVRRLRDQRRFESPEELKAQISKDVEEARATRMEFAMGGKA